MLDAMLHQSCPLNRASSWSLAITGRLAQPENFHERQITEASVYNTGCLQYMSARRTKGGTTVLQLRLQDRGNGREMTLNHRTNNSDQ